MSLRSTLISTLTCAAIAAIAATALTVPAAMAQAAAPKLTESQAGYYRLKVGEVDVVALSDGSIGLDTKLLQTTHRSAVDAALKSAHVASPLDTSVNAYLVKLPGRLILVDAGTGVLFGPTLNKLPASLKAAGVEPEQITDILVTHVHTDHTGGLMDGSRRVFPNAIIHLDKREIAFWLDPQNEAKAPAGAKSFFQQARASVEPYLQAKQVQTFDGATEIFAGVRSVPAPGHTPGHTFYKLESQGATIMFWGDVMHVAEVQLQDPSVTIDYDVDPKGAAAQRKLAFADAAERGYLVAPAHMSFPGVGHLRRDGQGYRWVPLPYVNDSVAAMK
jgi:glyoxylase-like metal-dependent hydrolase (beta-lactamase superfamily II)